MKFTLDLILGHPKMSVSFAEDGIKMAKTGSIAG